MTPWRWEIVGNMMVLFSMIGYATSIGERIIIGDLTTAELSVISQFLITLSLILGFTFQQIGLWQKRREDRERYKRDEEKREEQRQQDKLDEEERARIFAKLLELQAETVAAKAQASHVETLAHIAEVKTTAQVAFEAANHSNEKIARFAEHLDSSLQIVPAVAAAVADALKPAPVAATLERTPGTVLTETPRPSDGHVSE